MYYTVNGDIKTNTSTFKKETTMNINNKIISNKLYQYDITFTIGNKKALYDIHKEPYIFIDKFKLHEVINHRKDTYSISRYMDRCFKHVLDFVEYIFVMCCDWELVGYEHKLDKDYPNEYLDFFHVKYDNKYYYFKFKCEINDIKVVSWHLSKDQS